MVIIIYTESYTVTRQTYIDINNEKLLYLGQYKTKFVSITYISTGKERNKHYKTKTVIDDK